MPAQWPPLLPEHPFPLGVVLRIFTKPGDQRLIRRFQAAQNFFIPPVSSESPSSISRLPESSLSIRHETAPILPDNNPTTFQHPGPDGISLIPFLLHITGHGRYNRTTDIRITLESPHVFSSVSARRDARSRSCPRAVRRRRSTSP